MKYVEEIIIHFRQALKFQLRPIKSLQQASGARALGCGITYQPLSNDTYGQSHLDN